MPPFSDHPGYLGLKSQGVLAIHADWPAYALQHGWRTALETLGQFPRESALREISEVDQCRLFVLGDPTALTDPFDVHHLHAAIWTEDLRELHMRGFASGTYEVSLEQWLETRRADLAGAFWVDSCGNQHPLRAPTVEDFEPNFSVLLVRDEGITMTDEGWAALDMHLAAKRNELHASLTMRVAPLISIGHFDTAVREACLLLETRLRHMVGSTSFGQVLVAEFDAFLRASRRFVPAQLKALAIDMRTAFKFVRNEFMHGLHELTAVQCYALLGRLSRIFVVLDEVEQTLTPIT